MSFWIQFILALAAAFLCGSIPVGMWVARRRGVDIRKVGSGNIGFTNVWRGVGRKEGLVTLACDIAKGAQPVWLLPLWMGMSAAIGAPPMAFSTCALFFGLAAILGHCFTPFAGFKGGKGVATSLGVFLVLAPWPTLITFGIFAAIVAATRWISLGSVAGAAALPALTAAFHGIRAPVFWIAAAIGLLVIVRHRENIKRLLAGAERRFSWSAGGAASASGAEDAGAQTQSTPPESK